MNGAEEKFAPWEKAFDRVLTPFEEFIHKETTSGLALMACTLVALVIANSPLQQAYEHLLHLPIAFSFGEWRLEHSLHHWINDGLMWLFFFLVGLEIKREILSGELAEFKMALLPVVAAIGGMLVPALFYLAFNAGGPGHAGWGVPMATDIAFAVGVIAMLGRRVPKTLLTFLVALAIIDDLGAVAVIAIFYTHTLVWGALAIAVALVALLIAFNRLGIRKPLPYFAVGLLLWMALLESGVHATIAGILTAWTIPARSRFDRREFGGLIRGIYQRFKEKEENDLECALLVEEQQRQGVVHSLVNGIRMLETPLQRLEYRLHIPVAFFVIPLFALANAGIPLHLEQIPKLVLEPVTLGIILGLVLGKLIGIAGFTLAAARLGIGQLPEGVNARHIIGVGLLGGIGFTMSIFIADLAFIEQPDALILAKTGVLFASAIAGGLGYAWLRRLPPAAQG